MQSTLLKALAGKLSSSLQRSGDITYNGYALDEFVPQRTASYVDQVLTHAVCWSPSSAPAAMLYFRVYYAFIYAASLQVIGSTCSATHVVATWLLSVVSSAPSETFVAQVDNHTSQLTVAETFDFAARCQRGGFGTPLTVTR